MRALDRRRSGTGPSNKPRANAEARSWPFWSARSGTTCSLGEGKDTIIGDAIYGEVDEPDFTLTGIGGDDRIYGGTFDDELFGDVETIAPEGRGGDGNDLIHGDARFTLWGTGGNDMLY